MDPRIRLEPPYIKMCFYSHSRTAEAVFGEILLWLRERGFGYYGESVFVRSHHGRLPPFASVHFHALQSNNLRVAGPEWTMMLLESKEWIPIRMQLYSQLTPSLVGLEYTGVPGDGSLYTVHRPVTLIVGGADVDLLNNVTASRLPLDLVTRARNVLHWSNTTFRVLCSELRPSYASAGFEVDLMAPSDLTLRDDLLASCDLFIAADLVSHESLQLLLAFADAWTIETLCCGHIVHLEERDQLLRLVIAREGLLQIAQEIRRAI